MLASWLLLIGLAAASPIATTTSATSTIKATSSAVSVATAVATAPACSALPLGSGPVPSPDTAAAFTANKAFSAAATAPSSAAPQGWYQTYSNLKAATTTTNYLGYVSLTSYSVSQCLAACSAVTGCVSANIFYERDPTVDPAAACPNPASTTTIKCSLWGSYAWSSTATNQGGLRQNFQVAVAGSNAYNKLW